MRLVGLEVVVLSIKLDKKAVGENGHAFNDAKDCVSYGLLNQETVSDIRGIGEIQLEAWGVDERDLHSADLIGSTFTTNMALIESLYQGDDVGQWAEQYG